MKKSMVLWVALLFFSVFFADQGKTTEAPALVSARELHGLLENPQVKIIDVRPVAAYDVGHIPSALQAHRADYFITTSQGLSDIISRTEFEILVQRLGISASDHIIFYDANFSVDATTLAWIFAVYGLENTSILNGGVGAWHKAGFVLCQTPPVVQPSSFTVTETHAELIATSQDFLHPPYGSIILDVRRPDEYQGMVLEKETMRKGNIPDSVNLSWALFLNMQTKEFVPEQRIKDLFASVGVTTDAPLLVYCHMGVRSASISYLARRVLHAKNVKSYNGSWVEWNRDLSLPVRSSTE